MNEHSEKSPDWEAQRDQIIGLGKTSIRKSYFPELQQRILELEKKNRELQAAYAAQTGVEEELRQQFEETSKKEHELRESEERLIMAQSLAHLGSWEYSFETNKIWGSAEALRIYGFPPRQGYYPIADIEARVEDRERVQQAFVDFINGRREYDIEITINPLDGSSQRVVRSIARLEKDAQDRPLKVVGVLQDITEQKQAEKALRESEERFRNLIEASPVPIVLVREGVFLYTNSAFCRMTGYDSPVDVTGKSLLEFVAPEYKKTVAEYISARSRGEPAEPHYESIGLRGDGSRFQYEITVAVINLSDGSVTMAFITDITERKRVEEELVWSRARLQRAELVAGLGHWEYDLETRNIYASDGARSLYGFSGLHWSIADVQNVPLPEYRPVLNEALRALIENNQPYDVEFRIQRPSDGRILDIHSIAEFDPKSRVVFGVIQDVSERKRAEEALRESEEMFRSLIRESADGISLMDERGTVIEWNDAMVKISGIPREEAVGAAQLDMMVSMMIPEHRTPERIERFRQALSEAQQTGESVYFSRPIETRILRRDGSRLMIHQLAFPIRTAKGYRIGSIARDITEAKAAQISLKTSEEQYRRLVEITDTGYLVLDSRGLIIDANDVYIRLTGRSSVAELVGRSVTEWTAPYDLERNAREVEKCLQTGSVRGLEIDYIRPDGTVQPIEVNATVFHSGDGDVVLTLCRDISDRKQTNVALQQARNKLNLLNAVTFQDIQTAAFSLSAYQELVKNVITDTKAKSYLEKQQIFLKKMVDTLDFAKNYQEMGMHPPRWQNVRQVFLYAISHLDFLHMKQNLQLDNLEVFADPLLEKSLFNIMENVLKHGVHATEVTLRYEERPDGLLLLIEDNGVGISPAEKNMIFDRGYGKGTGLGLFLVREVLSITGMTIRETGISGHGTRFEIIVPKGAYRYTK